MNKEDIELAIVRVEGALANKGAIACVVAEGHGQSNRDVPVRFSHEDSAPVFKAMKLVLQGKLK